MKKWIYPLLMALLAWAVFVFYALFLQPKLWAMERDMGGRALHVSNIWLDAGYWLGSTLFTGCWILLGITLLLALPAVLPFLTDRIKQLFLLVFKAWALILSALVFGCLLCTVIESQLMAMAYDSKVDVYEKVLMEHAILEEAQTRHQKLIELFAGLRNAKPVETPVSALDAQEKKKRVQDLLRTLYQPASTDVKKRLLASLGPLRTEIKPAGSEEEKLLKIVKEVTGQDYASISDFFTWLDTQEGRDGWEPVPYYRMISNAR